MKKMLLIGMLIVSGLSYGRDFEYREKKELKAVEDVAAEERKMTSRRRDQQRENMEKYWKFHRDLDNLGRGREKR